MKLFLTFLLSLILNIIFAQTPSIEYFICKGSAVKIIIPGVPFTQADLDKDATARWSPRVGLKVDGCVTCGDDPTICFQPRAAPIISTTYTITVSGTTYNVRVLVATKFEVHPLSSDFTSGKEGCIFTASRPDILVRKRSGIAESVPQYYTNLQTQDRRVRIKAVLQPAGDFVGKTIYFNSIDPPDLSRYGSNCTTLCQALNGGCALDNQDDAIMNGKFTTTTNTDIKRGLTNLGKATAVLQQRSAGQGGDVAIAEIDLVITEQYQGDNYQVLSGLYIDNNNNIDIVRSCVGRSAIMIAWKRYYVEVDNMYVKGATISDRTDTNGDGKYDRLEIDNVDDLIIGTRITLIRKGQNNTDNIIKRISSNIASGFFYVDINEVDVSIGDGLKIVGNDEVVPIGEGDLNSYLSDVYGSKINGSDNGSFTELITGIKFSSVVPCVKTFTCINNRDWTLYVSQNGQRSNTITAERFATFWFESDNPALSPYSEVKNIRHLLLINKMIRPTTGQPLFVGYTGSSSHYSNANLIVQNYLPQYGRDGNILYRELTIGERHKVTIHEMGHALGLSLPFPVHIDNTSDCVLQVCPIRSDDFCLMTYCTGPQFSTIKLGFDSQCYFRLRTEPNDE